jgi:WD40 repeat protein
MKLDHQCVPFLSLHMRLTAVLAQATTLACLFLKISFQVCLIFSSLPSICFPNLICAVRWTTIVPKRSSQPLLLMSKSGMKQSESHCAPPLPSCPTPPKAEGAPLNRSAPISNLTFPTSVETITSVRFNLSESSVLASVGSDRTFSLYDIRTGKAERRVVMQVPLPTYTLRHMCSRTFFFLLSLSQFQSNDLSWCPTHPTTALLASEDHNLYTFDIRHLASPTQIYKGHVAAVMSCDWSPTGVEFVSGG